VKLESNDSGNERRLHRLRFSMAHEVGHFVLHQEEFQSSGFQKIEEEWLKNSESALKLSKLDLTAKIFGQKSFR